MLEVASRLQALKHTQRVCFRVRNDGPGSGNPLNMQFEEWSHAQSGHRGGGKISTTKTHRARSGRQGDRRASNLKTHLLGRDFALEVGPGGGKGSNTQHTT